jgi:hypothetical protein
MVVEIVVGPERMTRSEQKKAISQLGKVIGTIARRDLTAGEHFSSKVGTTLAQGTEDGETFNDAYLEVLREKDTDATK